MPIDDGVIRGWRTRVERAGASLGWPNRRAIARKHAAGVSLAVAAPCDQLFLATEVNEWALCAALIERDPLRWSGLETALVDAARESAENTANPASRILPVLEESAALARFEHLAALEARPKLRALLQEAAARRLRRWADAAE